jgi:hypothetical protein
VVVVDAPGEDARLTGTGPGDVGPAAAAVFDAGSAILNDGLRVIALPVPAG